MRDLKTLDQTAESTIMIRNLLLTCAVAGLLSAFVAEAKTHSSQSPRQYKPSRKPKHNAKKSGPKAKWGQIKQPKYKEPHFKKAKQ